jgi:hypothetical protein
MAYAHLILSGTMNDRRAAEAVGLNPETAAYTKSPLNPFIKPEALNRVPAATGMTYDAVLDRANPIRLSWAPNRRFSGRQR